MRTTINKLMIAAMMLGSTIAFGQGEDERDRSMQQFRYPDQRGINQFEALEDDTPFDGVNVRLGGALAVQFQALDHSTGSADTLAQLGSNFNLPTANLDLDIALAEGVRMHMRTYLSSRHHPESWVKGGYIQIGSLDFIQEGFLDNVMDFTTVKIGLMEINYGDYHFRRTDNARGIYNPFVGNLIMDAFNTEMGGEIYFTPGDFIIMGGVTNGNLNQSVATDGNRTPSFLGKLGYDTEINQDLRVRLTSSIYTSANGQTNYLYFGDRAGSRYYLVMEPLGASPAANYRSGRFSPSFVNEVTAIMVNPFVKYKGLEFLGTFESSTGKIGATDAGEPETRTWTQLHGELLYRFGSDEDFYVGAKYNTVSGGLPNFNPTVDATEASIDRLAFAAGWYMTKNMMLKAEYVNQTYNGFAETDLLHEGQFNGLMLEAIVSF